MAARKNLPKIITDIEDVVTQLANEFKLSNEPITDDNHALHRLCAKLEFLLHSSIKEKSVFGSRKNYWHWIYACLKNTKGLADGLKYVQANREAFGPVFLLCEKNVQKHVQRIRSLNSTTHKNVQGYLLRTSKGRARAFIRYCLVHQTLADSLQNCIMNQALSRQYFSSDSILSNTTYSSAFVTSLYELNAVNFDLNSKGFDLDSGWPTFSSKIRNNPQSSVDQWALQSHVGSLSSFPSASVIMDTPRMHDSGSSGHHSVDQRVEDLVLELDQSDQRIKEQQQLILELETKADNLAKSSNEKEDIFARVISDLESKNRHLHNAMSTMSSEFEAREEQWRNKHDVLLKDFSTCDSKNNSLRAKVQQLEQDKRTLEDTVSQKMTNITSAFVPLTQNDSTSILGSTATQQLSQKHKQALEELKGKNDNLSKELSKSRQRCVELQARLQTFATGADAAEELHFRLEEKQLEISALEGKMESLAKEHQAFTEKIKEALSIPDDVKEVGVIVQVISNMKEQSKKDNEVLQQAHVSGDDVSLAASLKEENELLKFDRDVAHLDKDSLKHKLKACVLEIEELKVELESSRSESANRIQELKERLSIEEHQMESHKRHHKEMLSDLKLTQDALQHSEAELEEMKNRFEDLLQKERQQKADWEAAKSNYEDDITDHELAIEELQAEVQHHSTLTSTLDKQLETEKTKCSRLTGDLMASSDAVKEFSSQLEQTKTAILEMEETLSELRSEVVRLTSLEATHLKQISFISDVIENFLQVIRSIDDAVDLNGLKLDDKSQEICFAVGDEDASKSWKNLEANFFKITLQYKDAKNDVQNLQKEMSTLRKATIVKESNYESEIAKLREQLVELQANNEIGLVTIKSLGDKQKALQESKAFHMDELDKLGVEKVELQQSLSESIKTTDELRLRVMEESAKRLEVEDKVKRQDDDIERLKDKITQLLLDKDNLWKEGRYFKDRFLNQSDVSEDVTWEDDDEVSKCSSCEQAFSITNRKHHCRNCGKIFCKNCASNWVLKDKNKVRVCNKCIPSSDVNTSSISSDAGYDWASPKSMSTPTPDHYEQLSDDECSIFSDNLNDTNAIGNDDSILPNRRISQDTNSEDEIVVAARRQFHLPVYIEQVGDTLQWEFTSDKDINFKIGFSPTEEDNTMVDILPSRKIDSHIKPFSGDLVANQEGVYTLVFDNTFSIFNQKTIKYKLGILPSQST